MISEVIDDIMALGLEITLYNPGIYGHRLMVKLTKKVLDREGKPHVVFSKQYVVKQDHCTDSYLRDVLVQLKRDMTDNNDQKGYTDNNTLF